MKPMTTDQQFKMIGRQVILLTGEVGKITHYARKYDNQCWIYWIALSSGDTQWFEDSDFELLVELTGDDHV